MSACEASVTCDASGTERCNPLCDSFDHGGKGGFGFVLNLDKQIKSKVPCNIVFSLKTTMENHNIECF